MPDRITAHLIAHTLEATNLQHKRAGDWVNIEFDVLGKYVLRRMGVGEEVTSRVTETFLKDKGFV